MNKSFEWALIILPPLSILLLVPIQPDLGSSIIWGPALICLIVSLIKLIYLPFALLLRKKVIFKRVIRQTLTIVIYIVAMSLQSFSQKVALTSARSLALELQKKCNQYKCPQSADNWSSLPINRNSRKFQYIKVGMWWTRYRLSYSHQPPTPDKGQQFRLFLYVSIDQHVTFIGGKDKQLTQQTKYSRPRKLSKE